MSRLSRLRTRQRAQPGRSWPVAVSFSRQEGRKPYRPNRPAESARAEPTLMADQVLPSSVQPAGCIGGVCAWICRKLSHFSNLRKTPISEIQCAFKDLAYPCTNAVAAWFLNP